MLRKYWDDSRIKGWIGLAGTSGLVAVCWLGVLPHLASQPSVRRHIERNQAFGIDPSAKFYTELTVMDDVLRRVEPLRKAVSVSRDAYAPE